MLGTAAIAPRALLEPARELEGVEVVAVASRDAERARQFAASHGIPNSYGSYDDLVADDTLDAVFIPLVNSLHAEWTLAALEAGRDVLCEKPLAANAAQAAEMVGAAQRNRRFLVEAFHWRFHPLAARVIELSGRIGTLRRAEARAHQHIAPDDVRFRLDLAGGVLMDVGCYLLHWLRTVSGEEPQVLWARASEGPPGVDVEMEAKLAFPSGFEAHLDCSMVDPQASPPSLRLEGAEGLLEVTGAIAAHRGNRITGKLGDGSLVDESVGGKSTYHYQLVSFLEVVSGRARPLTGGSDSINNMAAIDAVYQAAGLPMRQ